MRIQLNFFYILKYNLQLCSQNYFMFHVKHEIKHTVTLLIFTPGLHSILLTQPIRLYFNLQTFKRTLLLCIINKMFHVKHFINL